jgi:hypothetical protein
MIKKSIRRQIRVQTRGGTTSLTGLARTRNEPFIARASADNCLHRRAHRKVLTRGRRGRLPEVPMGKWLDHMRETRIIRCCQNGIFPNFYFKK